MTSNVQKKIRLNPIMFEVFSRGGMEVRYRLEATENIPIPDVKDGYYGKTHQIGYGNFHTFDKKIIGDRYKDWMEDELLESSGYILEGVDFVHSALNKVCVIDRIELYPEFRRYGLGTDAMKQIISFAKHAGCEHVLLHCQPIGAGFVLNYDELHAFYQSIGFVDYKKIQDGYTPHQIMKYDITN